jgi:hypothetical protein
MVVTLALILTFSPGEKEQRSHLSGFANSRPANPAAGFRVRRQVILPLPGGEGRASGSEQLPARRGIQPGGPTARRGEGERETFFNATGLAEIRLVALESDLSRRNQMQADESG